MKRLSLAVCALLAGCSQQMYDGDSLDDSEISRIETRGVDFHTVDGKHVESDSRVVEVLPGTHIIEARVVTPSNVAERRTIVLNTNPGKVYYLAGASTFPNCIRVQNEQGNVILEDRNGCKSKIR